MALIDRYQYGTALISEFLGTLILVLAGAGMVAYTSLSESAGGLLGIAFVFGLTVATLGILLGSISGAHVDPAVSLAHTCAGKLRASLFLAFAVFQVLGGIVGGIILRMFFPSSSRSSFLGSTSLASSINPWVGVALEFSGTFVLCSAILFLPLDRIGPIVKPILVGSTLFLLILMLGPFTGASLNPARSLGPALASGHVENLAIYFVGPLSGGLVAGIIGRFRG
jgi:MIP family channel proteins